MKKILVLVLVSLITCLLIGQQKYDLVIEKAAPMVYLNGTAGVLKFQGNILLTQSASTLTLSNANLALGANNLLGTGSVGSSGAGKMLKGWFTNLEVTNYPTVNGTSIATIFAPLISPSFTTGITTPAITLGATAISSSALELNLLDGALFTTTEANKLVGLGSGSIQDQFDLLYSQPYLSPNNTVFTGITTVDRLKVGSGVTAITIDSLTNIGQGLTVTQDGEQIGFNFPSENLVDLRDIAAMKHPDDNDESGTTYTLALTDDGGFVTCSNAAPITVTVPLNATINFPVHALITVVQGGAGQVTFAPYNGSVTINSADGALSLRSRYSAATLYQTATNVWLLMGDIE